MYGKAFKLRTGVKSKQKTHKITQFFHAYHFLIGLELLSPFRVLCQYSVLGGSLSKIDKFAARFLKEVTNPVSHLLSTV